MNDEDLDLYAKKLISTSTDTTSINTDVTDLLASTFTTTPNDGNYTITSTLPTGIITNGGSVSVAPSISGYSNNSSNVMTNWKLSHNGTPDVIDQTKEQQLEDVKDILNSVQRALEGLKTQVQVLSASIEDENELKHKRRKLGGDE